MKPIRKPSKTSAPTIRLSVQADWCKATFRLPGRPVVDNSVVTFHLVTVLSTEHAIGLECIWRCLVYWYLLAKETLLIEFSGRFRFEFTSSQFDITSSKYTVTALDCMNSQQHCRTYIGTVLLTPVLPQSQKQSADAWSNVNEGPFLAMPPSVKSHFFWIFTCFGGLSNLSVFKGGEVKVASAAHLSQKNFKDFRNASIFAQFEHFGFRSAVTRVTSCNTVQSRKLQTFTINIHQPGGYVCLVLPYWHCCAQHQHQAQGLCHQYPWFQEIPQLNTTSNTNTCLGSMLRSTSIYHFRFQNQLPEEKRHDFVAEVLRMHLTSGKPEPAASGLKRTKA